MSPLFFLLLTAACPLMMFFMMRDMHGGLADAMGGGPTPRIVDAAPNNARITELEREAARLREAQQSSSAYGTEPRR
jgi:hypothetical protein